MSFLDRHMVTPCWIVNRIEADERDQHNNPVYVDDNPIPTFCFVTPRAGSEFQDGRAVQSGWTLTFGPSIAGRVSAFSYIDVEGYGRLECDGEPQVYRSLTGLGQPHHVEVSVRRSST